MTETAIEAWTRCSGWIAAALPRDGTHTVDDVWRDILDPDGRTHFWPGRNAAFVTEILQFPQARILNVWLAGGDMAELLEMQPHIEAWAKAQGCTQAKITTRPGWERVLAPTGFTKSHVVLSKDL